MQGLILLEFVHMGPGEREVGGGKRNLFANETLYQLSYDPNQFNEKILRSLQNTRSFKVWVSRIKSWPPVNRLLRIPEIGKITRRRPAFDAQWRH